MEAGEDHRGRLWRTKSFQFMRKDLHRKIPEFRCSCGIYAAKTRLKLKRAGYPYGADSVIGQVGLWGKVIDYTDGWRAEFAYPLSFWPARILNCFKPGFLKNVRRLQKEFGAKGYRISK